MALSSKVRSKVAKPALAKAANPKPAHAKPGVATGGKRARSMPSVSLPRARPILARQVLDALQEQILSGQIAEGALLPSERELGEIFRVSRTVVREAIKALESRGLVTVQQGRGTLVRGAQSGQVSDAMMALVRRRSPQVEDLLEIRKVLELYMVERAARRRTEANLRAMEGFLRQMRETPGEPEGYVNADLEFHMEIARATQNPVLLVLLDPVSELSRKSRLASFSGEQMVKRRARQHEEILKCIRRRDPQGAREAMSKHLGDTQRDLDRRKKADRK